MTTYDIELVQGDTDRISAVLLANGTGVNITQSTVTFIMTNNTGLAYSINCTPGATVSGSVVSGDSGGITVPFLATETTTAGLFYGRVTVTENGEQQTFPSSDNYLAIKIWEGV